MYPLFKVKADFLLVRIAFVNKMIIKNNPNQTINVKKIKKLYKILIGLVNQKVLQLIKI